MFTYIQVLLSKLKVLSKVHCRKIKRVCLANQQSGTEIFEMADHWLDTVKRNDLECHWVNG